MRNFASFALVASIGFLCSESFAASFPSRPLYPSFFSARSATTNFRVDKSANTSPSDINDAGVVIGTFNHKGVSIGFIRQINGKVATFKLIDDSGDETVPTCINNKGVVVGFSFGGSTDRVAFIRGAKGDIKQFSAPSATGTEFDAINNHGVIAGEIHSSSGTSAFVRAPNGTLTTFSVGKTATGVSGINDSGVVAGGYAVGWGDNTKAFIRQPDGTIETFHIGSHGTAISSINKAGDVVGNYMDKYHNSHPFLRTASGKVTKFDIPNAITGHAIKITDQGSVVGSYNDSLSNTYGFLVSPSGNVSTFDLPSAESSWIANVNNNLTVTGGTVSAKTVTRGYLMSVTGS
ncbi:MAG: hypothetical protein WBQ17_14625 [Rhizomicrobium sp.]